ncbi:MAG TPA: ferritin-like domain-containing protein [Balneolaceae bacterium]
MSDKNNMPARKKNAISRKNFFKYAGASAVTAVAVGLYGCDESPVMTQTEGKPGTGPSSKADTVDLGSGDIGILNYAYALEQLEAAFYIQVLENAYSNMSADEGSVLEDLRSHEIAHRDFYNAELGSSAIPPLEVDFSSIDFSDRAMVLQTARTFEDLGVSAYNGAAHLIQDPKKLLVAGKIVSVEARHAAAIRDLIGTMEDDNIIDENGLDVVRSPGNVLSIVDPYVVTEIDASGLPQPQITYPES